MGKYERDRGGDVPFFTRCVRHLLQEQSGLWLHRQPVSTHFFAVIANLLKCLCDSRKKASVHEEEVINTSNYKYIPLKIDINKQLQTALDLADLAREKGG